MLAFLSNHFATHHKHTLEPTIMGSSHNNYTITNQEEIRKKLNHLFGKNVLLSIKVPGKFATSTLLTTINHIEGNHIFLGGFQNDRLNMDLQMQSTLVVTANFEGIAVNFLLSELSSLDIDSAFNIKAALPQSMEWVQRRDARRVKVPINIPVKIQPNQQDEYFDVSDISVSGLSYIVQSADHNLTTVSGLHSDCTIILPDKSQYLACFEVVNNIALPFKRTRQINRVGCEIKKASYQLDTALQRLINKIDFYYQ